jgi:hypothetical protein
VGHAKGGARKGWGTQRVGSFKGVEKAPIARMGKKALWAIGLTRSGRHACAPTDARRRHELLLLEAVCSTRGSAREAITSLAEGGLSRSMPGHMVQGKRAALHEERPYSCGGSACCPQSCAPSPAAAALVAAATQQPRQGPLEALIPHTRCSSRRPHSPRGSGLRATWWPSAPPGSPHRPEMEPPEPAAAPVSRTRGRATRGRQARSRGLWGSLPGPTRPQRARGPRAAYKGLRDARASTRLILSGGELRHAQLPGAQERRQDAQTR